MQQDKSMRELTTEELYPCRQVPRKEVKMHFLLADAFKPAVEKDGIPTYPEQVPLALDYALLLREHQAFSEEELDSMIRKKDPTRLERYNSLDWRLGRVALSDIGPWPEMDGLDIRLTTGNVPETVDRVGRELARPSGLRIPTNFAHKIESILAYRSLILPGFPIILFPGGLERGNHNLWVRTSGEVKKEEQDSWICRIFKYDNDAGNARAFAYCLSGLLTVEAYFGKERE